MAICWCSFTLSKQHLLAWLCSAYLLLVRDKHFLCLLDHRLRLQLLVGELVLAWVEQLSTRHTGQHQVGGIRLEIDVHFYGVRVNGRRRVAFFDTIKRKRLKFQVEGLEHFMINPEFSFSFLGEGCTSLIKHRSKRQHFSRIQIILGVCNKQTHRKKTPLTIRL